MNLFGWWSGIACQLHRHFVMSELKSDHYSPISLILNWASSSLRVVTCSPSRCFYQQLATVRINRLVDCYDPMSRERVAMGREWDLWPGSTSLCVCWIMFVLSFVTMQEVTATSRHYVDRLFDPDPQNVLQGVMWVQSHVSFMGHTLLLYGKGETVTLNS